MNIRAQLRFAAEAEARTDTPPGSTYLYGLAALLLSGAEDDERTLSSLFHLRATLEAVDGDEVLSAVSMVALETEVNRG
jgi:hypothetical protein